MGGDADLGHHSRSDPSLKPGIVISHYRIARHLGTGGMGEVYAADDLSLKRLVALKILLPEVASDALLRQRFEKEADSLASMNHPNVETIYEIGSHGSRPYIVAEYIDGQSLLDRISEGPLAVDEIVDLATQICSGLMAIHEAKLIHRDIKPSNILIDAAGHVHIVDFGIAHGTGESDKPGISAMAGTIGYMSPEQITGEALTPAADMFSLGVVLYEMAAAKRPFAGEYEAAVQYAIVHQDPEPVSAHRTDLPEWLSSLIMTLLAKRPEDRYECADVIHGVLSVHGGETAKTPPSTEILPAREGRRTWMTLIILLAVIVMTVLVVALLPRESGKVAPTLAVLPFQNLGPVEDEYFADGITDAVITRLARLERLRVTSRHSSMQYRDSDLGYRDIGSELGADYILIGTIFWDKSVEPNRFSLNTRLIRSSDESYIWGETYDRVLENIIPLQSDIAEQVAAVLKIALSESDRRSIMAVPTISLDAYDYFLRGIHYFNQSWDQIDILNATEMFQHATEADSGFALAFAMLARGHESMFWEYFDRSEERCDLARQAANKALELQPGLVEGHLARGYIFYHCEQDYKRALEEFKTTLLGYPNNADLYSAIAAVQRRQGDLVKAADNFMTSFALDPRSHLKAFDVALTCGMMRQFDLADEYIDKTLLLAPNVPLPYVYKAWIHIFQSGDTAAANVILNNAAGRADIAASQYYWWLSRIVQPDYNKTLAITRPGSDTAGYMLHRARLYRLLDQPEDEYRCSDSARQILETCIMERPDDPRFHSQLGLAYAGLRDREKALAHGRRAMELLPISRDAFDALFFSVNLTEIFVVFDMPEASLDQLEYLMSIPGFISAPYLRLDPLWKPLRYHSRFQKLLRGV